MNIQEEVQKIHKQFGVTEKANYEIERLFESHSQILVRKSQLENQALINLIHDANDAIKADDLNKARHIIETISLLRKRVEI